MTFKEMYGKYNEEIRADETVVAGMMRMAQSGIIPDGSTIHEIGHETKSEPDDEQNHSRRGFCNAFAKITTFARPFAAVAAACLCLLITMPVLADSVPYVEKFLNLISPELAQQFIPVQLSDEAQGIRMEVVAINLQEDGAQVYITMQDLEGDRLDETTDLYDSANLNIPFDCVANCQNLGYDAETGKVTFLISMNPVEGATDNWYEEIKNSRITFSVRKIIGQKNTYEEIAIPVSLTEADLEAETVSAPISGSSGGYLYQNRESAAGGMNAAGSGDIEDPRPRVRVLRPDEGDSRFPVEGVLLTGMGYVDGLLHIQYGVENRLENDNHGHFFLKDTQGNVRMYDGKVSFRGITDETEHIMYEDCVFDISAGELDDYTLYGYFVTSGLQLEGGWKVKFRLGQ